MSASTPAQARDSSTIGYGWRMLIVVSLGWAIVQTVRFVLPVLVPEIRVDLTLTLTEAGIALTVLNLTYAIAQYPSGRLSDSWSRATIIVPSFVLVAFASLLIGVTWGFLSFVVACAIFGIGMGTYAIPVRALVSDLFVTHRGRALGVLGAGADIGGVLASAVAIATLALATWQTPFFPITLVVVGLLALFIVWNQETYRVHRTNLGLLDTIRRLITTPSQRWTLVSFTLFYFMVTGVLNFLPAFLRSAKGFSPEFASASFAFLFAFGIVVKPLAGSMSDRFPRRLVATGGLLIGVVAIVVLVAFDSVLLILFGIFLFAVGYKTQFPVIDALLMDDAPDSNMGGDLGAARTLFLGIGSLGPAFVGFVADVYDYSVAFSFLGLCLLAAAAILAWQSRH